MAQSKLNLKHAQSRKEKFTDGEHEDGESEDDDIVFYHRFFYSAKMKKFKLAAVPLYCVCTQPQNPDHLMIQCEVCKDWYHPKCIGMTDEEANALADGFVCYKHRQYKCDVVANSYNIKIES